MSTDDSYCRFPNCDCKIFIPLKFQDKFLCRGCSHYTDLHAESVNFCTNASFATPLSSPTPQHCYTKTESKPEPTSQRLPTPNHDNFIPLMPRVTEETLSHSVTTNHQILKLSHEFSLCDRSKTIFGKRWMPSQ